jgi:DNA-binding protein YbaB
MYTRATEKDRRAVHLLGLMIEKKGVEIRSRARELREKAQLHLQQLKEQEFSSETAQLVKVHMRGACVSERVLSAATLLSRSRICVWIV